MNKKENNEKPFLKVDYSQVEQPEEERKLQEVCNHTEIVLDDISLTDGNYPNRKSTIISGHCTICGYSVIDEL